MKALKVSLINVDFNVAALAFDSMQFCTFLWILLIIVFLDLTFHFSGKHSCIRGCPKSESFLIDFLNSDVIHLILNAYVITFFETYNLQYRD
jgi:hypothetical protein